MAYEAKILRDSLSPDNVRLTTFQVTFPRIVLAEFNTHRVFSRNSASSRAIPVEKMLQKVMDDPFIPVYWGKNQKGMQAEQELTVEEQKTAEEAWLIARSHAVADAARLLSLGIHKQITNRLLEPWLWHTVIVTATEWDNFWGLRCNPMAQPEIKKVADMMRETYIDSTPRGLALDEWHMPLVDFDEVRANSGCSDIPMFWQKVSAGRCARVSYLTHDGKRDVMADVELCDRLVSAGHMSPLEHVARPMTKEDARDIIYKQLTGCVTMPLSANANDVFCGNLRGWISTRKTLPNEDVFRSTMST